MQHHHLCTLPFPSALHMIWVLTSVIRERTDTNHNSLDGMVIIVAKTNLASIHFHLETHIDYKIHCVRLLCDGLIWVTYM